MAKLAAVTLVKDYSLRHLVFEFCAVSNMKKVILTSKILLAALSILIVCALQFFI